MSKKLKGLGEKQNSSISLSQRAKLFVWLSENKESNETYSELAKKATDALGFNVSDCCLANHWVAVNGRRNEIRVKDSIDESSKNEILSMARIFSNNAEARTKNYIDEKFGEFMHELEKWGCSVTFNIKKSHESIDLINAMQKRIDAIEKRLTEAGP